MRYTLLILLVGAVVTYADAPVRGLWSHTYGGMDAEIPYSLSSADSNGYLLAGSSATYGLGGHDQFWVVRADSMGSQLWDHTFAFTGDGAFSASQYLVDGGHILAGNAYPLAASSQMYASRLDASGTVLWEREYGGSQSDYCNGVVSSGGGFVVAGTTTSFGSGGQDLFIIKTNENGDSIWSRTYGGTGDEFCGAIVNTNDGGYLLFGTTTSFAVLGTDLWAIKVNANGDSIWSHNYDGNFSNAGTCACQTNDGGYLLGGMTVGGGSGQNVWVMKISASGITEWEYVEILVGEDVVYKVAQLQDGGYVACGYTETESAGGRDFYLQKLSSTGAKQWGKTFGGSDTEQALGLLVEGNGSRFVLAGNTLSFGAGDHDMWLVKAVVDSGCTTCAAEINSAEYWIDSDPGSGNGTALVITPAEFPTFSGEVNASSLPAGLHSIGTRFRDDRNIWGSSEIRLFYVLTGSIATNVTSAEYWLDVDPGAGNGTSFAITPGSSPNIAVSLPFEALETGLHTLGMRFSDDRNVWGSNEVRLFYVTAGTAIATITAAEYWVDTDPEAGGGTALTITPGTNPVALLSLPLEALPIGLHSVGVRFKDDREIWGLSEVRLFYVLGNVPAENIIAAEYWLDSDPGAGNGTSIAMSPGQTPMLDLDLPFNGLGVGLHHLGIRFRDDRNIWGPSEARLFYVISPIQAAYGNTLTSAEYFINYDPGPGAGVQIPLPTDGNWDSAFETITDSIEHIPGGWHWIGLRFSDERGVWGSMIVDTFVVLPILTILPTTPPVLNWQSDSSSMYYVHRSAISGGPFAIIDSTTARTYTDIENPLAPSTRFYRITQRLDNVLATFRMPSEPQQAKVIARAPLGMSKSPSGTENRKQSNDNTK